MDNRDTFHTYIEEGNLEEVKDYVRRNESEFYENKEGESALYTSIMKEQFEIYAFLKSKGVLFKDDKEGKCINNLGYSDKTSLKRALIHFFPQIDNSHILFLVSKSKSCTEIKNSQQIFEELYQELDKIPEISSILKVIQYGAFVEIIFDFTKDSVTEMDPTKSRTTLGSCDCHDGRLYIGAKGAKCERYGTLAHELTHLAMQIIYMNNSNPYGKGDKEEDIFIKITQDTKETVLSNPEKVDHLIKLVYDYPKTLWPAELIVRVPHMLAKYGEEHGKRLLNEQGRELLEYYTNTIIPRCNDFVQKSFLIAPKHKVRSLNEYSGIIKYIKELNIEFKENLELEDFMKGSNNKILLLNTRSTLLSTIKVYQTLNKISPRICQESCLFFSLEGYNKNYDVITKTLHSEACNLLVIDCGAPLEDQKLTTAFIILPQLFNVTRGKRVIFISEEGYKLQLEEMGIFTVTLIKLEDEKLTFNTLTSSVQNKLLQKEVILQHNKISLCKLIGGSDFNNLSEQELTEIIDLATLVKLVRGEEIKINNKFPRVNDLEAAYSKHSEVIKPRNLVEIILGDNGPFPESLFLISTVEKGSLDLIKDKLIQQLGLAEEGTDYGAKVKSIKDKMASFNEVRNDKCLLIDKEDEEGSAHFRKLCQIYPEKIIYCIKWEYEKLLWKQLYNPKFYLARTFKFKEKIIIKNRIKEELGQGKFKGSCVIFSGVKQKEEFIKTFSISSKTAENDSFILETSEEKAKSIFKDRSKEEKCIHLLKVEGEELIWHCSKCSLDILNEYIDEDKSNILLDEEQFANNIRDRVTIITESPGMGKSTTVTMLSDKKLDSTWVIRINLKDCRKAIKGLCVDSKDFTIGMSVNFLLDAVDFDSDTDLATAKCLLKYKLSGKATKQDPRLLILFDGFDEIKSDNNEDKTKIGSLLKYLKDRASVVVTARNHETNTLQNTLASFKTEIQRLSLKESEEFLKNSLMYKCRLSLSQEDFVKTFGRGSDNENNKFERYFQKLFKHESKASGENTSAIFGTPLTLCYISVSFESKFKKFIESGEDSPSEFDNFGILDLYQDIVSSAYDIYIKDKTGLSEGFSEVSKKWMIKSLTESLSRLAFTDLFEDKAKGFLGEQGDQKVDDKELRELCRVGLIQSVKEGQFEFIHKTVAEYFVASAIMENITRKSRNPLKYEESLQFLLEEMFTANNAKMVSFLDCMLSKDSPILSATVASNWEEVRRLLKVGNVIIEESDDLGRTAVHLSSQRGNAMILKALLEAGYNSLVCDHLGRSPLHYAANYGRDSIVVYLAEINNDIKEGFYSKEWKEDVRRGRIIRKYPQSKIVKYFNLKDKLNKSALNYAEEKKEWFTACWLVMLGADINDLREENKEEVRGYYG